LEARTSGLPGCRVRWQLHPKKRPGTSDWPEAVTRGLARHARCDWDVRRTRVLELRLKLRRRIVSKKFRIIHKNYSLLLTNACANHSPALFRSERPFGSLLFGDWMSLSGGKAAESQRLFRRPQESGIAQECRQPNDYVKCDGWALLELVQCVSPSISCWRDHAAGASNRRATPIPSGSRPSTAALTRLGARNASEIVIYTWRLLQVSRAAMPSIVTCRL
jgi:hypothetical protein